MKKLIKPICFVAVSLIIFVGVVSYNFSLFKFNESASSSVINRLRSEKIKQAIDAGEKSYSFVVPASAAPLTALASDSNTAITDSFANYEDLISPKSVIKPSGFWHFVKTTGEKIRLVLTRAKNENTPRAAYSQERIKELSALLSGKPDLNQVEKVLNSYDQLIAKINKPDMASHDKLTNDYLALNSLASTEGLDAKIKEAIQDSSGKTSEVLSKIETANESSDPGQQEIKVTGKVARIVSESTVVIEANNQQVTVFNAQPAVAGGKALKVGQQIEVTAETAKNQTAVSSEIVAKQITIK